MHSVGRSDAIAVLRVRSGLQVAEIDVGIGGQGPDRLDDRPGATADTPGYLGLRCALVPPTHPDLGRGAASNREVTRLMPAPYALWPYRLDRTARPGGSGRGSASPWHN